MSLAELMIPEFDAEMARTRNVLEPIPAERMDWHAAEGLHTISWNANHLINTVSLLTDVRHRIYARLRWLNRCRKCD